jgi:hypothetical protein
VAKTAWEGKKRNVAIVDLPAVQGPPFLRYYFSLYNEMQTHLGSSVKEIISLTWLFHYVASTQNRLRWDRCFYCSVIGWSNALMTDWHSHGRRPVRWRLFPPCI